MIGATLFSGIGAPETAMPEWRWIWAAEHDPAAKTGHGFAAVLAERHPDTPNLGDVTADDFIERASAVGRPDILVFGSPCQSFSVAGRRIGLDDPRGNLALVALGIVARLKPRWFVFENVPGLLSSAGGRDFGIFLRTVDDVGYSGAWSVLDAQYFGVAQRRRRVFFVGHIGDWRGPAAVLLQPESLRGDTPPRREAGKGITHNVAPCLGASGVERAGETRGQDPVVACYGGNNTAGPIDVAAALNAHGGPQGRIDFESETFIAHSLRSVRRLLPVECERLQGFSDDYTAIQYRGKPAADGPRYKALGNSMAAPDWPAWARQRGEGWGERLIGSPRRQKRFRLSMGLKTDHRGYLE